MALDPEVSCFNCAHCLVCRWCLATDYNAELGFRGFPIKGGDSGIGPFLKWKAALAEHCASFQRRENDG